MRCAIWYHLYNLKNVKNTHGGVLILAKLQAEACDFTKESVLVHLSKNKWNRLKIIFSLLQILICVYVVMFFSIYDLGIIRFEF